MKQITFLITFILIVNLGYSQRSLAKIGFQISPEKDLYDKSVIVPWARQGIEIKSGLNDFTGGLTSNFSLFINTEFGMDIIFSRRSVDFLYDGEMGMVYFNEFGDTYITQNIIATPIKTRIIVYPFILNWHIKQILINRKIGFGLEIGFNRAINLFNKEFSVFKEGYKQNDRGSYIQDISNLQNGYSFGVLSRFNLKNNSILELIPNLTLYPDYLLIVGLKVSYLNKIKNAAN